MPKVYTLAVRDAKNTMAVSLGKRRVVGMLLNSKYVDSDGVHPDGVVKIFNYGDESVQFAKQLGSDDVHGQQDMAHILNTAVSEVQVRTKQADDSGCTIKLLKRNAAKTCSSTSILKSVKASVFGDSPEETPRTATRTKKLKLEDFDAPPADAAASDAAAPDGDDELLSIDPADKFDDDSGSPDKVPLKLIRDTSNAYFCRSLCRLALLKLSSANAIQQMKTGEFRKLITGVRTRVDPKALCKYPDPPHEMVLERIQANPNFTMLQLNGDDATSIMESNETCQLGMHLDRFLANPITGLATAPVP